MWSNLSPHVANLRLIRLVTFVLAREIESTNSVIGWDEILSPDWSVNALYIDHFSKEYCDSISEYKEPSNFWKLDTFK